jgi:hypothetical protein
MNSIPAAPPVLPPLFFGAFDRHNFGDILLGHIAAREAEVAVPRYAGLAKRDLRACGGFRVAPVDALTAPVILIHVGGELLDCDAAEAAWMLGDSGLRWPRRAPYVMPRQQLPAGSRVVFRAVGGVGLADRDAAFRQEVLDALRQADALSVRDRVTREFLASEGIVALLEPDPVARIAELFGAPVALSPLGGAPYLAVQFSAECGDDRSLAAIARGLEHIGLPVALFRAGAAPWHDDLAVYARLAQRLNVPVTLFESLDVWQIAGLIAGSRGFVGSSLHARLVANAFGRPGLSLERTAGSGTKLRAYLNTWLPGEAVWSPEGFADAGAASFVPLVAA